MRNSPQIRTATPDDNAAMRAAVYGGDVFILPPGPASLELAAAARGLVEAEIGSTGDVRQAQFQMSSTEFFDAITRIRKQITSSSLFDGLAQALIAELGFDPAANLYDPVRLRAVTHAGHENPKALPAYGAHRDTWYANSQAQLNWWIPLFGLRPDQCFSIYPEYFSRAIANSSSSFDYDRWISNVGWQNYSDKSEAPIYPEPSEPIDTGISWRFEMRAGGVMIFSASHLHQTFPNLSGETRFSLDFRTVHTLDHSAGLCAPNVDNASTGSALRDYRTFASEGPR